MKVFHTDIKKNYGIRPISFAISNGGT